jgi:hypothetical protein
MTEWKPTEINEVQPIRDFAGYQLTIPKLSNWTCYLFGGSPGDGIAYTPVEGKVPNRFVRFMTRICFACTWVKKDT